MQIRTLIKYLWFKSYQYTWFLISLVWSACKFYKLYTIAAYLVLFDRVIRDNKLSELWQHWQHIYLCISYTADKHSTACGNWGQGSFTEPSWQARSVFSLDSLYYSVLSCMRGISLKSLVQYRLLLIKCRKNLSLEV